MDSRYAISIVLEAHLPFVRECNREEDLTQAGEEGRYFEFVSEIMMPLLETINRLDNDHVPFKLAIAISPVLCHLLNDAQLQKKYLAYVDKQIDFGRQEVERAYDSRIKKLAQDYYNQTVDRRIAYTEQYEKNLLKAFDFYKRKGKLEILASSATHAFLPFISHNSESLQAQMEIPAAIYRRHFGSCPQGFCLPDLGWTSELEPFLRAYNYTYTILDTHGLLCGSPPPDKGIFYPAKTPNGTFVLARDLYAARDIKKMIRSEVYRNNDRDAGYELPLEQVSQFLGADGERRKTGYKYRSRHVSNNQGITKVKTDDGKGIYNPAAAANMAVEHARDYLENTITRLKEAAKHMTETPISLLTHNVRNYVRFWYEGPQFLEALFRMASENEEVQFVTPSEYIFEQNLSTIQVVKPEFSSNGENGYAETWLDVSNDWIYRHLSRAMERMTELAERFPDDSGIKERALNQAAREILLAQSSDWPELLHTQESTEYAHVQAENSLRNFTTIYEALGSNYISTEWLTNLERRHNIFPNINYRVFRRKK